MKPIDPEELSKSDKLTIVLHFLDLANSEITRYRNFEWKITTWTVALLAGVVLATKQVGIPPPHLPVIKTLLVVFSLWVTVFGCWHICFVRKRLVWNRTRRWEIEQQLGFFKPGLYLTEIPLLADPKKVAADDLSFSKDILHLVTWFSLIGLTATYTIYSICMME